MTELNFLHKKGLMWLISLELSGNYNIPSCLQTMKWTKKAIGKCIERNRTFPLVSSEYFPEKFFGFSGVSH